MQRRIEAHSRTTLWIERIVWNAAATAALAVMILVLLGSLRWLDEVAPRAPAVDTPAVSAAAEPAEVEGEAEIEGGPVAVPVSNRPTR